MKLPATPLQEPAGVPAISHSDQYQQRSTLYFCWGSEWIHRGGVCCQSA